MSPAPTTARVRPVCPLSSEEGEGADRPPAVTGSGVVHAAAASTRAASAGRSVRTDPTGWSGEGSTMPSG
jgi:hypothetical protein